MLLAIRPVVARFFKEGTNSKVDARHNSEVAAKYLDSNAFYYVVRTVFNHIALLVNNMHTLARCDGKTPFSR